MQEKQAAAAAKEQEQRAARRRTRTALCLSRSCLLYLILNFLYFLIYMAVVFPQKGRPFAEMLRGGITVKGHLVFFLCALVLSVLITLLTLRRPLRRPTGWRRYLRAVSVWYAVLVCLLILVYGIYLDMLYDPYLGTEAALLKGPSFLLTFSCLCFALCMPAVNRIYRTRLPRGLCVLLHFLAVTVLSLVFFFFLSDGFASSADFLIFAAVFAVCYAAVCAVYFLLAGAKRREENEAQEYVSLYQTADEKKSRKPSGK